MNTKIRDLRFDKDDRDNVHISFAFNDLLGRPVHVTVDEGINKASTPLNLLAPIGAGSLPPQYFPLFWLYDFTRTRDLHCVISIDGKDIEPDPFPVPLPIQGQFRNFIRYTFDSRLYSIFDSNDRELKEVSLDEEHQYIEADVVYQFNDDGELSFIKADSTCVSFEPGLDLEQAQLGVIRIATEDGMGHLKGDYRVEEIGPSSVRFSCHFSGAGRQMADS